MATKRTPPEISSVPYRSPADAPFGVEVMSFARLRDMGPRSRRAAPQRPQFHVLGVIDRGVGHHTVDCERHALGPGSVLWLRPGQVHQFDGVEEVQGTLVLFQPDFLAPGTLAQAAAEDTFGPTRWQQSAADRPLAALALDHLSREYADGEDDPFATRVELLRHLLAALVLRLLSGAGLAPRRGGAADDDTFRRFRQKVERDFARHRKVAHYARELGYAPRTLSRATLAEAGVGAKEFIDQRVVLEAKRLLVHGELPAARCATELGFDDAANFAKFFQRHTGHSPGAFRALTRPGE
ncbi:MAG TPA: AraC family transcriptional regulator [Streptomyces sp.]